MSTFRAGTDATQTEQNKESRLLIERQSRVLMQVCQPDSTPPSAPARTVDLGTDAALIAPESVKAAPAPTETEAWRQLPRWRRMLLHIGWTAQALRRYGRPQDFFMFDGGIGDELLCTAVFHEMSRRGDPPAVMMSKFPDLFEHNPHVVKMIPYDTRYVELARRFGHKPKTPGYAYDHIHEADCIPAPPYPIIARMCKTAGLTGPVDVRTYVYLTEAERSAGKVVPRQVAIMSSGLGAKHMIRNKQWYSERYQAVVDQLRGQYDFVQLGDARDPLLEGALDLRGKTSLRESAAILSQSLLLVGQVGFLMHLARGVDCRSVIVYGGREHPYQSGYICNENLYTPLHCSPCWLQNTCAYDRLCMKEISAEQVVEAIKKQVAQAGTPLATDIYTIGRDPNQALLMAR
jgi:hypothetical protein